MQVLEAEVSRGGPETLLPLLRALPWLLARFCAALRRSCRRAGADERPDSTDGAGALASPPAHAADFDFFAALLRPLLAQLSASCGDATEIPAAHADAPGQAGRPGAAVEGESLGSRKRRRRAEAAPAGEPAASKRARRAHDERPEAALDDSQGEPLGWRWVAAADGAAQLVEALCSTGSRLRLFFSPPQPLWHHPRSSASMAIGSAQALQALTTMPQTAYIAPEISTQSQGHRYLLHHWHVRRSLSSMRRRIPPHRGHNRHAARAAAPPG